MTLLNLSLKTTFGKTIANGGFAENGTETKIDSGITAANTNGAIKWDELLRQEM